MTAPKNAASSRRSRRFWRIFGPLYAVLLAGYTAYVLLDAFVIPRSYAAVVQPSAEPAAQSTTAAAQTAAVTANSYTADGISITLTTYREYDTEIYVADITLADASALKTAFAEDTYGKNVTAKTSAIAAANSAVLAINGDYYGVRSGYVIRNGTLYRSTSAGADQQDLVLYADGTMAVVCEGDTTAQALLQAGAVQVLSFGPGLLADGQITVGADTEVDRAKTSNPRTAIGQIGALHYVMVVADGRTSESTGLSLYQLATFLQGLGVQTAYNLDGGGSSTMVFNGAVVNNPTTNGSTITERSVSDIVYIG